MPQFAITVVNDTFRARDVHDLRSADEAGAEALKGALAIGADEVCKGKKFFGAEVTVEQGDEMIGRFIVSLGATRLM